MIGGTEMLKRPIVVLALLTGLVSVAAPAANAHAHTNAPRTARTVSSVTFHIRNDKASGKCIGIASIGYAGDWNCTNNPDQTWHWGDRAGASGWAELVNGNGQCLSLSAGGTA